MLSSRLFWKLFLACAGVNLAAAVTFGLVISGWQEEQILEQVQRRLQDSARLVQDEVVSLLREDLRQELQQQVLLFGQKTGIRFTVIALEGIVLADSEKENLAMVTSMDNHRSRPEIMKAVAQGEGFAKRISPTMGEPYRYFALRAEHGGSPVGVVRTAITVASIESQAATVRRLIWSLAGIISLGVLALSYWIVGHMLRPVVALTAAAEAIASGNYKQRIYVSNRDELGTLARSFQHMSEELDNRIQLLRQSNEQQATVLGGMNEGLIAIDREQRVVLANAAAGRLFNFQPLAIEGRLLLEVVRHHELHRVAVLAMEQQQPQHLEIEWEGTEMLHLAIQATPLPGTPCPGAVLVLHDTTALRQLESLRRDFLANVSHELKTPLSSIKAYAETLQAGAIDDRQTALRFARQIEEQADRLHHLILDMLSLARIESDQQAFDIVSVSIGEVVRDCLGDQLAAAEAKQIGLQVQPDQPPLEVRADREGLREILDNLVDNAIKYTPEGGQVTVGWDAEEGMAQIKVQDTGIGIGAEDLPRVFERFYRVDKARSRELGGTGLGLAIVKHLAQSFGGNVDAKSQRGEGSTFTVRLPLV